MRFWLHTYIQELIFLLLSVLAHVLFDMFIRDLGEDMKDILIRFVSGAELRGLIRKLNDRIR